MEMKPMHLKKIWAFGILFSTLFICQPYVCLLSSLNSKRLFLYPIDIFYMDWLISGMIVVSFAVFTFLFIKYHYKARRYPNLVFILILMALMLCSLPTLWILNGSSVTQQSSVTQNHTTYRAFSLRYNRFDLGTDENVILYKCGRWGIVCQLEFTTDWQGYYGYSFDASLNVDSYNNQLQLRVNNQIVYAIDDYDEDGFRRQRLPRTRPITVKNSPQITDLLRLPSGMIRDMDWSSNGQKLFISSSQPKVDDTLESVNGIWVYTLPDFERSFIESNAIQLLDSPLPRNLFTLDGEILSINPSLFARTGYLKQYDWVGYGNTQTHILSIYSADDLSLIGEIELPTFTNWYDYAIHPDGQRVAVPGTLINLDGTDAVEFQIEENVRVPYELLFSPDGNILAITTSGKPIYLIDNSTGEILWKIGSGYEWALAFSPDSKLIAFAQLSDYLDVTEYDIKLYSTETGELVATLNGHEARIIDIEFNPAGTLIASTSLDGTIRLWGVPQ